MADDSCFKELINVVCGTSKPHDHRQPKDLVMALTEFVGTCRCGTLPMATASVFEDTLACLFGVLHADPCTASSVVVIPRASNLVPGETLARGARTSQRLAFQALFALFTEPCLQSVELACALAALVDQAAKIHERSQDESPPTRSEDVPPADVPAAVVSSTTSSTTRTPEATGPVVATMELPGDPDLTHDAGDAEEPNAEGPGDRPVQQLNSRPSTRPSRPRQHSRDLRVHCLETIDEPSPESVDAADLAAISSVDGDTLPSMSPLTDSRSELDDNYPTVHLVFTTSGSIRVSASSISLRLPSSLRHLRPFLRPLATSMLAFLDTARPLRRHFSAVPPAVVLGLEAELVAQQSRLLPTMPVVYRRFVSSPPYPIKASSADQLLDSLAAHIVTNLRRNSDLTFRFVISGVNLGTMGIILGEVCGNTGSESACEDADPNYQLHHCVDFGKGAHCSVYFGACGNLVIRLAAESQWHIGFSVDAWVSVPRPAITVRSLKNAAACGAAAQWVTGGPKAVPWPLCGSVVFSVTDV